MFRTNLSIDEPGGERPDNVLGVRRRDIHERLHGLLSSLNLLVLRLNQQLSYQVVLLLRAEAVLSEKRDRNLSDSQTAEATAECGVNSLLMVQCSDKTRKFWQKCWVFFSLFCFCFFCVCVCVCVHLLLYFGDVVTHGQENVAGDCVHQ